MKKNCTLWYMVFVIVGGLLVSGCGVKAAEPVVALVAASASADEVAAVPTDPPAVQNTAAPAPTEPAVEGSPTPTRIEFAVQNADFEIRVIDIEKPTHVDPDGDSFLYPGPGNMFLGLGVRVKNLSGEDITLKWSDVYLVNKYQEKWYPMWGSYVDTNSYVNPLTVKILEFEVHPDYDPDAHFYAGENGFLRAIYRLPKDNLYYYFGFADLPLIEINYRYH